MALWLSENDVYEVLKDSIYELVVRLDEAHRDHQSWDSHPRIRHDTPSGRYQYMGAVVPSEGAMGLKTYVGTRRSGYQGVVVLFDLDSGELLSVMACDILGRWRTGAASAVAAMHLAKRDAVVFGLIGSGRQAMTQLAAVRTVCEIRETKVFSRDVGRLESFCQAAEERFHMVVSPVRSSQLAAAGADIVTTVTSAKEVVLRGSFLDHPCHINAVGANARGQQELDPEVFRIADLVAVDDLEQARVECGDVIAAVEHGAIGWDDVVTLRAAISHESPIQVRSGITVFESQGIAAWDVIAANFVYMRCRERGLGVHLPWSFDPGSLEEPAQAERRG